MNNKNRFRGHATGDEQMHGVRQAFYSNLPGPNQTAWLECLCGEELTGQTSSWEDVGHEMDLHLERAKRGQL